ncbi:glycosyltransferase family 2 protein [Stutzerimonas nitrititolerans]|uniref:glycosyltransferase family 2 protein n=1 Tax=Stutzerimonas nitrititolerans TaxID=2482751 RepID=UPI003F7F4570
MAPICSVSVVIPCYKCKSTIRAAVESVSQQTLVPAEVILVDDYSCDGTLELLYEISATFAVGWVKVISLGSNRGPSAARNAGWNSSKQKYIAFLDSDDVWHPQKLELAIQVLNITKCDLIGHSFTFVDNSMLPFVASIGDVKEIGFFRLLLNNFAVTPSVVVATSLPFRFDESMRYVEDHELWLRISMHCRVCFIPLPLARLGRPVLTQGGQSSNRLAMRLGELKLYFGLARKNKLVLPLLPFLAVFSVLKHIRSELIIFFNSSRG